VLEFEHNHNDEKLYKFETTTVLEMDKAPFNLHLYSNLDVNAILKGWSLFLGMTIGWQAQG